MTNSYRGVIPEKVGLDSYRQTSPLSQVVVFATSLLKGKGKEKEKGLGGEERGLLYWCLEN